MKYFISLLLVFFICVAIVGDSLSAQSRTSIGIVAGTNFGSFKWPERIEENSSISTEYIAGISVGLSMQYNLNSYLYADLGLQWTERGGRMVEKSLNGRGLNQQIEAIVNVNYLELPVLIGWRPFVSTKVKPFLAGGISYSILVSGSEESNRKVVQEDGSESVSSSFSFINERENYRSASIGSILCTGVDFPLGENKTLGFSARYYYGFQNIVSSPQSNLTQLKSLRNRDLAFLAAFRLALK